MSLIRRNVIYVAPYIRTETDDYGNEKMVFGEPYAVKGISLNSVSGYVNVQLYGDRVTRMVRTFVNYDDREKFKENDRAYLYGSTPNGENTNGNNANYRVVSVLPQNKKCQIMFEMLPK